MQICPDCKLLRWHSLVYCYHCGKPMLTVKYEKEYKSKYPSPPWEYGI